MPAGRKNRSKQRRKRRHKKMLLERSRRCRDEQVNNALDETDIMLTHISGNTSFHLTPASCSSSLQVRYDSLDGLDLNSSFECSMHNDFSSFSTPKKKTITIVTPKKKFTRSFSSPSTLALSTIPSQTEESDCECSSPIKSTQPAIVHSKSNLYQLPIIKMFTYTKIIVFSIPTFISKVTSWIRVILKKFIFSSFELKEEVTGSCTTMRQQTDSQCREPVNSSALMLKLDEVLATMSRLELKHNMLLEKVELLGETMGKLHMKPVMGAGIPPPPPPPPPPPLVMTTPVIREKQPKTPSKTSNDGLPPRPSITLQDILNVQLRKTPKQLEKTPLPNGTTRGPLVSVDMLRSVKLRPSQMRRRSIERPLQTPSSIYKIRSP